MRLEKITSRENQRLIRARKVRDGKVRDLIFIEGRRLTAEALHSELNIAEGFVIEGFEDDSLLSSIAKQGIEIVELSRSLFQSIAETENTQGIILLAKRPMRDINILNWPQLKVPLFVFLKEVNNPSNLGAVLRSVEAAGAGGVFISRNSADVFSPKALRASMGAAFRVPIRADSDLLTIIGEARAAGFDSLGVDGSAKTSYLDVDWTEPRLVIYGSEAHGLTEDEVGLTGGSIAIPMENSVESLNLAVAAGIVLFEAKRQVTITDSR